MVQRLAHVASLAAFISVVVGNSIHSNGRNFLGASMQPEVVAKTLLSVEDEWKDQAASFLKCELSKNDVASDECGSAPQSFSKSCEVVVGAIVKGSDGDTEVTKEYMIDVCSQPAMTSWRRDTCISLAKDVAASMTASAYENRVNFKAKQACDEFWSQFLAGQRAMHQKELDAKKAEEAERMKKEEQEKAEEAKKQKEEEEKRKSEDEAKRKADAQKEAQLEALREQLKMKNATEGAQKMVEEKAQIEAVDMAAEEKLKEASAVDDGSKDVPKLANSSPDLQKAYAVLKAADALTADQDTTSSPKIEKAAKQLTNVSAPASAAPPDTQQNSTSNNTSNASSQ
mmetsp:Transcript_20626/g.33264  ORF Transcript_20626/g.33264 Transcript_20626/m.33264 type:complete len:342 (-) Transcript_20626:84-1109(-)|eukprot:CAMPEP_0169109848 /NCGR_PEP_ID=MMETSP1015-20121227/26183_1 /TAXON_ID=342587 /ORGANISM="Karlodinium micrum, Strain CCMP2283" /LENGTH=341 /DNA_ID=CAMNT_0009171571 /DNA_START=63 /DNA_END=1088 /DNA_ORIENTATION=-